MVDFKNKGFFKLKQNDEYSKLVTNLLADGEEVIDSYKSIRDGVVFTNFRLIVVNVQGATGKKKDFSSIPYNKFSAYSIETAGTFDLDAEFSVWVSGLGKLKFEFKGNTKLDLLQKMITQIILK